MSHLVKTLIFAGVAVAVSLVAVLTFPRQETFQPPELIGKALFSDFTDPDAAAELKIVEFNDDVGELKEFEVARDNKTNLWVIPSSSDYPADADTQMRNAATALIDLMVLDIASTRDADQEMYGVVEPDKEKMSASQQGVGRLVVVRNSKGKDLARLIIGGAVKGSEEQRFVRIPGQNVIYVVKIDPSKFPTQFEKWIERDLLKLTTFDIQQIELKDYSILTGKTLTGQTTLEKFDQRFEADVRWDSTKSEWQLTKLVEFPGGKPRETRLLDSEELNKTKLDSLKTALGDLKIVGVRRKDKGLGADLKAGAEIMNNNDSLVSLMNRGFFPVQLSGGAPELRAANGEVLVGLKTGVQYLLRFGETANVEKAAGEESKLNRYMFVMARLDESQFPPLELEPLPEGAEPEAKTDAKTAPDAPAEPAAKAATDAAEGEKPAADKPAADQPEDEKSDLELERERIQKENQRKRDARDEEIKKAKQKVAELNGRFADWYYIIAEDEYKKIHLGRNDLIQEKATATEEGFDVDAFRKLQDDGLKKTAPAPQ